MKMYKILVKYHPFPWAKNCCRCTDAHETHIC